MRRELLVAFMFLLVIIMLPVSFSLQYDEYSFTIIPSFSTSLVRLPLINNSLFTRFQTEGFRIVVDSQENLTDYQLRVNLSNISDVLQSWAYNFAFQDPSGKVYPYCFEQSNGECNQTPSDVIWVKVNLSAGSNLFYLYPASSLQAVNGDQVFDFYDDFNSGVLNTSKWTVDGIQYSLENGKLKTWGTGVWGTLRTKNPVASPEDSIIAEVRFMSTSPDSWHMLFLTDQQGNNRVGVIDTDTNYPGNQIGVQIEINGAFSYPKALGNMENNQWYYLRITKISQTHFRIDFFDENWNLIDYYDGNNLGFGSFSWYVRQWKKYSYPDYWDWVRVRKYTNPEPTVTIEGGEVNFATVYETEGYGYVVDENGTTYRAFLVNLSKLELNDIEYLNSIVSADGTNFSFCFFNLSQNTCHEDQSQSI